MSSQQGANEFTLSVEFAGVCLYVIDDRRDEREVAVLMPTCLTTPNNEVKAKHDDGTDGARHVPYLLMDLANFDQGLATPGLLADGPKFQVVRRLSREEIFFGLQKPWGAITLVPDPLPLPDLGVYRRDIQPKQLLLSQKPPVELNGRTILKGGKLTATTIGGSDNEVGGLSQRAKWDEVARLSKDRNKWDKSPADWAGSIQWTREKIPGNSLSIEIRSWDKAEKDQPPPLTLTPVQRNSDRVIELKIAVLCEDNPLEWREFEAKIDKGKKDVDFKWLFRLFDATKKGSSVGTALGGGELPYPLLNPRGARTTGSTGCTGGQFGIP